MCIVVGHDAPGFHQLIDAVANPAKPEPDWFKRWHAKDQYCKQLEARIAYASFTNERLAQMTVTLLEQVRELNRQLLKLHNEREQA